MKSKFIKWFCFVICLSFLFSGCIDSPSGEKSTSSASEQQDLQTSPSTPMEDYGLEGEYVEIINAYAMNFFYYEVEGFGDMYGLHISDKNALECYFQKIKNSAYMNEEQNKKEAEELYSVLSLLDFNTYQVLVTQGIQDNMYPLQDKVTFGLEKIICQQDRILLLFPDRYMSEFLMEYEKTKTLFYVIKKEDISIQGNLQIQKYSSSNQEN